MSLQELCTAEGVRGGRVAAHRQNGIVPASQPEAHSFTESSCLLYPGSTCRERPREHRPQATAQRARASLSARQAMWTGKRWAPALKHRYAERSAALPRRALLRRRQTNPRTAPRPTQETGLCKPVEKAYVPPERARCKPTAADETDGRLARKGRLRRIAVIPSDNWRWADDLEEVTDADNGQRSPRKLLASLVCRPRGSHGTLKESPIPF